MMSNALKLQLEFYHPVKNKEKDLMKTMSIAVCSLGVGLGLAFSASAGNVTLAWDAASTPATLGDAATGLLEFTYVDGVVSNITAHPVDGGTIVMTGDQINVCSLAHVIMAGPGELVFSNAVHGTANLYCESTVQADYNTLSYSGGSIGTEYVTLFANQDLEDWMPLKTGNSGSRGWWSAASSDNIPTYNIRRETDGTITAQRQAKIDSHLFGVVKFQLKQSGTDIAGRCVYAGYWNDTLGIGKLGDDADAVIVNPVTYGQFTSQGVTEPGGTTGYGINKITLSRVGGLPTVRFAGGLSLVQVLYARQYTHVVYERATTGSAGMGYQADANGILTFRDPAYLFDPSAKAGGGKLSDFGIKGAGIVEFEATDALYGDETGYDVSSAYTGWITDDWITIAKGQQLSALTGATSLFAGPSMHATFRDKTCSLERLSIAADGQTATGQFQYLFGGWLSGVTNRCAGILVEFRQNGQDVQIRATEARSYGGNDTSAANAIAKYGTDLSTQTKFTLSTTGAEGNYGVHNPTLVFQYAIRVRHVTMGYYPGIRNMAGATSAPGCKAQLIVKGTDNTKMRYNPSPGNGHVLPYTDGLLRIKNGGEVIQRKSQNSSEVMWVEDRALIYIEEGGVFRQQTYWGLGFQQRVDIMCGGEFRAFDVPSAPTGQLVLNLATFSGNVDFHSAQIRSTDMVRAGYKQDAIWTVRGTSTSTFNLPLSLWGMKETDAGGNTMTFAVNNVTGTSASDFIMNGAISRNASEPDVLGVYKTGSGTMQLNASYNVSGTPTFLKKGTWLLNGSSLTSASDPYTIDGGTLAVTDGTANSLGVLTVGAAGGGITLGAGATLTFADSGAATWDAGERVVITGFAARSIRFGTTKSGLTPVQASRFRTSEGRSLTIGNDGYLCYRGTTLIIR